ncbi:MAG: hypothetical protein ACJ8M4_01590, partial [Chthoniobacterales bacterium]
MKRSILGLTPSLRNLLLGAAFIVTHAFANTVTVHVGPSGSMSYSPDPAVINVNDTVQWMWDSSPHSVTSTGQPNGNFDSGLHNAPFTFSHTFS